MDNIENFKKEKKSSLDLLNKNIESAQKQIEMLESTYKQYSSM
jgi:hypothetical protein